MASVAEKVPTPTLGKEATETSRPVGRSLWQPFDSLRSEVDRLFDEFSTGWPFGSHADHSWPAPEAGTALRFATDIEDTEKEYRITAELPGIDEKDVEITATDDRIVIRGEKREQTEKKENGYTERRYGSFQRSFGIPDGVVADRISATMKNGVLTLVLPKSSEVQRKQRKIAIKAG